MTPSEYRKEWHRHLTAAVLLITLEVVLGVYTIPELWRMG